MSQDVFCPLTKEPCRLNCAWLLFNTGSGKFECAVASRGGGYPSNRMRVGDAPIKHIGGFIGEDAHA